MSVIDDFGSADWANYSDLRRSGFVEADGLTLGYVADPTNSGFRKPVTYCGDQHIVTCANNRSGKGTTAIVPALLDYDGSMICIDVKGENAIVTAKARHEQHKHNVQVLDPWGITTETIKRKPARFNPLDTLNVDSSTLSDDCEGIAENIVIATGGDDHWSIEAKALIVGFIGYVATHRHERKKRHLGRVRDILNLPPVDLEKIIGRMHASDHDFVRKAAGRWEQKTDREAASVLSTANANTHFLDSPAIRESMSETTFSFDQLKSDGKKLSVYLVIPADRLRTHGRWLRVIIGSAIKSIIEVPNKPKKPALFVLDEFAALGRMNVIEQAFGLMAGYGMQMWVILQDLNQLQDLYKTRWESFIANAGVFQVFGTRDLKTADYVSRLAGTSTRELLSDETERKRQDGWFFKGDPSARDVKEDRAFARSLITGDETMRIPAEQQLLFLPKQQPLLADKIEYFKNARYFWPNGGQPKFRPHPNYDFNGRFWFYTKASKDEFDRYGNYNKF